MMQDFYGEGALRGLESCIIGAKNIFLITGRESAHKNGLIGKVKEALRGFKFFVFSDVAPNPTVDSIDRCLDVFRADEFDMIIGFGGGSVIDTAKIVSVFAKRKDSVKDFVSKKIEIAHEKIPCIAIPTLAGSGAEVTPFVVFYNEQKKCSIDNPLVKPDSFISDPVIYASAPFGISFLSAIDALSHAVESYWSTKSNEESDIYATCVIGHLPRILKRLKSNPKNVVIRNSILEDSTLAGKSIAITRTTAPHALSYPLTGLYGFPHGVATALLLPYFMEFNSKVQDSDCCDKRGWVFARERIEDIAEMLVGKRDIKIAAQFIRELIVAGGVEIRFPNLKEKDIKNILYYINLERLQNNPRAVNMQDAEKIYTDLLIKK